MFTIDESNKLGSGTFGSVFSGLWNGLPVAVKKIDLRRNSSKSIYTEVKIQQKLKHANIVTLFTAGEQNNFVYLVLELMGSGDLFDLLYTKDIPLDSLACVTIAQDIVAGLDYIHDQGFLHRDIKPENILFNDRMQAKIADFGLATQKNDAQTSRITGTKDYMAPELALSVTRNVNKYEYNELTDSYSLGITLLEMICREPPYGESGNELLWEKIALGNHREIPRETHPILADIISWCLTKNPEDRINLKGITQLLSTLLLDAGAIMPPAVANNHIAEYAIELTNNKHLFFNGSKQQKTTQLAENSTISSPGKMFER